MQSTSSFRKEVDWGSQAGLRTFKPMIAIVSESSSAINAFPSGQPLADLSALG
jgi:hypothetical protein